MEKNDCLHEEDVTYLDLVQVDGEPMYLVQCVECKEYGTIELVEDTNTFGMTEADIKEIKLQSV